MIQFLLKQIALLTLKAIIQIRNYSEKFKYLDKQWYLNYLDELNKLSIDQDR